MIDKVKIEQAIKLLLEGIGEDPEREGLVDTPNRIARMYEEIFSGMTQKPEDYLKKYFHVDNNSIIIEKDIEFHSMCEHHLLPFYGKVHIGYVPSGKVVGLSKLARIVEVFARRLQIQEQMAVQIADALYENILPEGVMVMVEAKHLCMTMRGIKKPNSKTVSYVTRGIFDNNVSLQQTFMQLIV